MVKSRQGQKTQAQVSRLITGWDLGLFLFLGFCAIIGSFYYNRGNDQIEMVTIKFWDGRSQQINLLQDQQLTVQGKLGPVQITVSQGQVRITESLCPEQICINTGELPKATGVIVCVPNGILLEGQRSGKNYDAITW